MLPLNLGSITYWYTAIAKKNGSLKLWYVNLPKISYFGPSFAKFLNYRGHLSYPTYHQHLYSQSKIEIQIWIRRFIHRDWFRKLNLNSNSNTVVSQTKITHLLINLFFAKGRNRVASWSATPLKENSGGKYSNVLCAVQWQSLCI